MKIGLLFAGQGSQALGMGKEFYTHCVKARELLHNASEHCKINFENLLFNENEDLNKSEFTQPAVMLNALMSYFAFKEHCEFENVLALGHSLGEFSALAVQGGLNFLDALFLVNQRGKFMQEACEGLNASMMVVLGANDEAVEKICQDAQAQDKKIYAANYNCDGQIVVAGLKSDLLEYENSFKEAGAKRTMLLNMSVASHCPLLQSAADKLKPLLETALSQSFSSVVSNASAKIYRSKDEALSLLPSQLTKPVLYKQSIKEFADSVDCFVEFGTNILTNLNKKITTKTTYSIQTMEDIQQFIKENKE